MRSRIFRRRGNSRRASPVNDSKDRETERASPVNADAECHATQLRAACRAARLLGLSRFPPHSDRREDLFVVKQRLEPRQSAPCAHVMVCLMLRPSAKRTEGRAARGRPGNVWQVMVSFCRGDTRPARGSKLTLTARTVDGYRSNGRRISSVKVSFFLT